MLLKQQLLFIGIFFLALSYSTAQIKVVEEKKIEHNGAVSASITPDNKIITYSIVSEKGSDDKIEIVSYDEPLCFRSVLNLKELKIILSIWI